ncbi:predicted protein [Histoplasma capsulatum G186AR]|uniref:Uncharacterized protein n=1 Tax=Ajellomyces capsulatus (strain G186AR / H82 / ATCC MYA-2454 / RMSCC 2432) TaxID=447093 RepID=C0NVN8_AJECG|nr:uncharacterized protein HCBG_07218 [Histoplasma capsulatum G186AR]EEH04577.1 predicted protein [Histoplasma capsulatum G186AR]
MSNCPHISSLYLTSYLNHYHGVETSEIYISTVLYQYSSTTLSEPQQLQSPSEKAPSQGICLDSASLLTVNVTCDAFPKRGMTPPPKLSPVVYGQKLESLSLP